VGIWGAQIWCHGYTGKGGGAGQRGGRNEMSFLKPSTNPSQQLSWISIFINQITSSINYLKLL
jgi:hypothetical protein